MAGNYLDALFGRFYANGVEQELVGGINVKSPLTATVNNETGALDVSLTIEAAAQVPYDNGASELSAANVQAALDELAAAVDAIGGGSAHVRWDESNRRFTIVGAAGANRAGYTLRSSGGALVGGFAYNESAARLSLSGSATQNYIEGNWEVTGSVVVPAPSAAGHATTRSYVDGGDAATLSAAQEYVSKNSFSASGVSWTDGTNNGTADVHAERVGNVVALQVSVTASGSTGPSIVSAVGFLPEWARPSVTISSLSDYHTASNTIFAVGAHANGQVTLQKRLISSSGITTENWTSSEERTLLISYPVPAS